MPRLLDLLVFLKKPEYRHLWVLLDIKVSTIGDLSVDTWTNREQIDNDADDMMRLLARTIEQVEPAEGRPWHKRILLGCWTVSLPDNLCHKTC